MDTALANRLGASVRAADPDRYFSALFAPAGMRPLLFALYAFNAEVARVAETVREPMLSAIRLEWWRETVEGAAQSRRGPRFCCAVRGDGRAPGGIRSPDRRESLRFVGRSTCRLCGAGKLSRCKQRPPDAACGGSAGRTPRGRRADRPRRRPGLWSHRPVAFAAVSQQPAQALPAARPAVGAGDDAGTVLPLGKDRCPSCRRPAPGGTEGAGLFPGGAESAARPGRAGRYPAGGAGAGLSAPAAARPRRADPPETDGVVVSRYEEKALTFQATAATGAARFAALVFHFTVADAAIVLEPAGGDRKGIVQHGIGVGGALLMAGMGQFLADHD